MASTDFTKDSDAFHKCDSTTCICDDSSSCHSVFCYQLQCFGLKSIIDDPHCLFHVQQEKPFVGEPFNEHFDILAIYSVNNTLLTNQYNDRKSAINFITGNANEKTMYHVTKANITSVINEGLDPRYSQRGFFGRGIYFSESPVKCNDYSKDKGDPTAIRIMMQCRVVLGRSKEYELGHFDRDLVCEPSGYQSVKGFIRRDTEYVVYNRDQIVIDKIIIYRYTDTTNETARCLQVPPNITGHIVYITASLSEFFSKLQHRTGPPGSANFIAVKRLIVALLKKLIDIDQFLGEVSLIIKAAPPPELVAQIRSEMERCILGNASAAAAAAATTTATTTATTAADVNTSSQPQVHFENDYEDNSSDTTDSTDSTDSKKRKNHNSSNSSNDCKKSK